MANILPSAVPIPIPDNELKEIIQKAKDWAIMHGAAMRSQTSSSPDALVFVPFMLIPSAFPQNEFNRAVELQVIINELMHKVAHHREFLTRCLKDTIQVDEFTRNLFKIYETIQDEGVTQHVSLGLLRCDYMVHSKAGNKIKQVEINTIASSSGGTSTYVCGLNRFVLRELGYHDKLINVPESSAHKGLCSGMLQAHKLYGKESAAILFIVEDVNHYICDQRLHEFEIKQQNPHVKVIRRTLTQIASGGQLSAGKKLIVDSHEVAVIYFRAGYDPGHYHSQKEWDARLMMERSLAIKCPSIHYHLAGTKKVQQELAKKGTLEMFLEEASKIKDVKEVFAELYSLDFDEFGNQGVQVALESPEKFVMKPQREGGGNNIYGIDVREAMLKMKDSKDRTAWILMERIEPPISKSYLIRPGGPEVPEVVDLISELGIYGVIIGDSTRIFSNQQVGHLLRTKPSTANEGGVLAGLGALDSVYLID